VKERFAHTRPTACAEGTTEFRAQTTQTRSLRKCTRLVGRNVQIFRHLTNCNVFCRRVFCRQTTHEAKKRSVKLDAPKVALKKNEKELK